MNKRCIVGEILIEDGFLQRRRRLCQTVDNGRYIGHYKDEQEINTDDQVDNAPGFSILIKAQECCWKRIRSKRYQDIKRWLPGDTMTSCLMTGFNM